MKGDFSRQTFDARKHYSGVLMQQGRVQTDADWNEQEAIQRRRTQIESRDVIGRCGAPEDDAGFAVAVSGSKLTLGAGREPGPLDHLKVDEPQDHEQKTQAHDEKYR